jgi:hypothetical protein
MQTTAEWARVCERVSEMDEPPIRRCPICAALSYEVERGRIDCLRCGTMYLNPEPKEEGR